MKDSNYTKIFLSIVITLFLPVALATVANALDYHMNCNQCHNIHTGPGANLLHAVNAETVCMSCHDGSAAGAPQVTIHETSTMTLATCVDCHDAHSNRDNYADGTNTSLVGISYDLDGNAQGDYVARVKDNNVSSPTFGTYYNVDFEDPIRKFIRTGDRDAVAGARRICQVCHIAPPAIMHPVVTETSDCSHCHWHDRGFTNPGP